MIKAIIRNTINGVRMWLTSNDSGWCDIRTYADFKSFIDTNNVQLVIIEADHRYVYPFATTELLRYAIEANLYYYTDIIDNDRKWTHSNMPAE